MGIFDNNLKELRRKKEVSQKEVAKYLGITPTAYGYYESGKRIPTLEILKALATFYDTSLDSLVGMAPRDEEKEFTKLVDNFQYHILNAEGLLFHGKPISDECISNMITAIQVGLSVSDKHNK